MQYFTYKIVDERGDKVNNQAEPSNIGEPNADNPLCPKSDGGGKVGHNLISLATFQKLGSTAMSFGGSHISTYTGSTAMQNQFNAGAQLAGTAVSIINNPAAGLATLALTTAKRALEIAEDKRQDNAQVSEARKRAGASCNASRM